MADRLRGIGPAVLTEPIADWRLPAPHGDVFVSSAEMAQWVRSRNRRPILVSNACDEQDFLPAPSRGLAELSLGTPGQLTPPSRTAIDLGCGSGRDAYWLQAHAWEVLGVDRLPPQAPIPFVQANLHEFRTEQSFNLVLLHYCWDPEYLKLAIRLCHPGGRVSILAHSELHRACFGQPRRSKTLDTSGITNVLGARLKSPRTEKPTEFRVLISEEFWSLDRHSVRIVLERHTSPLAEA